MREKATSAAQPQFTLTQTHTLSKYGIPISGTTSTFNAHHKRFLIDSGPVFDIIFFGFFLWRFPRKPARHWVCYIFSGYNEREHMRTEEKERIAS